MRAITRTYATAIAAILLSCGMPFWGQAAVFFEDTFDGEAADPGNPDNYSLFGTQLSDRGVETSPNISAPNSAYITVDFGAAGFGVVMIHDAIGATAFTTNATLSVQVRADTDESGNLGTFGFRLRDADGSEYRTATADLFAPSTSFQLFTQSVTDLTTADIIGGVPGLDFNNIVRYDLVFLDQGDVNDVVNYNVDNFTGQVIIPEPSTFALLLFGSLTRFIYRRRSRVQG